MKTLLYLIISLAVLCMPTLAHAQYVSSQAQPNSQLAVNKSVKNAQANYLPGQNLTFNIEVRNTGQTTLNNIQVKDTLPDAIDWVSGPGNFDRNSRTLNVTVDQLGAGQSRNIEFTAKIKDNQTMNTCITNVAQARVNELFAQGTAVFCIQTQVLGTTSVLPKTGPMDATFVAIGSLTSLFMSAYFYRKSILS